MEQLSGCNFEPEKVSHIINSSKFVKPTQCSCTVVFERPLLTALVVVGEGVAEVVQHSISLLDAAITLFSHAGT